MKSSTTAAMPGTSSSPSLAESPPSDAEIGLMGYDQRVLVLGFQNFKELSMLGKIKGVEARAGIEPACKDLQSSA